MEVSPEFTWKSLWNVELFPYSNSVTHGIQVPGKPTVASLIHDVAFQQISHPTPRVVLGPALELKMNCLAFIEPSLHARDKSHLIVMYNLFNVLLNSVY